MKRARAPFRAAAGAARVRPAASQRQPVRRLAAAPAASKPVFITTPIFYANAQPHIGHLHSAVLGDALSRWHQLRGSETFLLTGTDEHGLKVQQAAAAAGLTPLEFCDGVSARYRVLFDQAGIEYDRFVRTTEPAHAATVQAVWQRLERAGAIYKGEHAGWYCVADEAFVPDGQVRTARWPWQPAAPLIAVARPCVSRGVRSASTSWSSEASNQNAVTGGKYDAARRCRHSWHQRTKGRPGRWLRRAGRLSGRWRRTICSGFQTTGRR